MTSKRTMWTMVRGTSRGLAAGYGADGGIDNESVMFVEQQLVSTQNGVDCRNVHNSWSGNEYYLKVRHSWGDMCRKLFQVAESEWYVGECSLLLSTLLPSG